MEKLCEHCGETFEAKRKDVVYCSASCRQMAYMNRKLNFNTVSDSGKISFSGITLSSGNEEPLVREEKINDVTEDIEQIDDANNNLDNTVTTTTPLESAEPKELANQESKEELKNYESKFNSAMVELFNDRELDVALNTCFYSQQSAPSLWVGIRLKCLVECLLMFSEMKYTSVDDLKEVCNAFILMTQSDCFIHLPANFPYTKYIIHLREKLKTICIANNNLERIKFRINRENKIELIVTRFELSHFLPKKKFCNLDFGEYIS